METPDLPDECLNGDHDFGQAGRCSRCNVDRADTAATNLDSRRTGGAGALTNPLTDGQYRQQMDKLTRLAAVDSDQ